MGMPTDFINDMKNLHFTMKLCRIMKRLYDEHYNVEMSRQHADLVCAMDPLHTEVDFLNIRISKEGIEPITEYFRCNVIDYKTDPLKAREVYDGLADAIYNKVFATADDAKPRLFVVSKEEALFIRNFKEELASRGDFVVDIPKFVDVLFKLGVMIPKEDMIQDSETE